MNIVSEHLVIFTRYPEVGCVKTRLIPALGADAATELHRQMAEYTLNQVRAWRDRRDNAQVIIQFAGVSALADLQAWLGADLEYRPQVPGDLGERLIHSFQVAFGTGATKVVTIGTDCPGITPALLRQAFVTLDESEVVLGPALDGGYYLIGLRSPQAQLFQQIHWGTSTVFAETLHAIQHSHLSYTCLEPLADVDRPADLPVWNAAIAQSRVNPMSSNIA